jgi:hypothetical protein
MVFGAVFMLLAVQGTAIRRATRESVELERRARPVEVAEKALEKSEAGDSDQAQAYIEGAADADPAIASAPVVQDTSALLYVRRVAQALVRLANASDGRYKVSLDKHIDHGELQVRARDLRNRAVDVHCKYVRPREGFVLLSTGWVRTQFERLGRAGGAMIVVNSSPSPAALDWIANHPEYSHIRLVPWGDTEDDANIARALDSLFEDARRWETGE